MVGHVDSRRKVTRHYVLCYLGSGKVKFSFDTHSFSSLDGICYTDIDEIREKWFYGRKRYEILILAMGK